METRPLLLNVLFVLLAGLNAAGVANAITDPASSFDATATVVAVDGLVFGLWLQIKSDGSRKP